MTDSQMLLLVVTLIYLSECAHWTNLHCVAVYSRVGFWWRWTRPGRWFGNRSGGLLFEWPIPPLGTSFVCQMWPLSVSPFGIFSNVSSALELSWRPDVSEAYVPFDQVDRVGTDEKKLQVNRKFFCKMSSEIVVRHWVEVIRTLKELSEGDRAAAIEQSIADTLDVEAIDRRLVEFFRRRWIVRLFSNIVFVVVFVAAPVAVSLVDWLLCWIALLAVLMVSVMLTAIAFRRAHAALFPDAKYYRRMHVALMLLNPLSAIRAHDALARDLLTTYHPLAVVYALCDKATFRGFARRLLLDLRYPIEPICHAGDVEMERTEAWFRARSLAVLEAFVEQHDVPVDPLLQPDPPLDDKCHTYCPRCRCQYVMEEGLCESCGGIALVNWESDRSST